MTGFAIASFLFFWAVGSWQALAFSFAAIPDGEVRYLMCVASDPGLLLADRCYLQLQHTRYPAQSH
jgi:hypothetical protein